MKVHLPIAKLSSVILLTAAFTYFNVSYGQGITKSLLSQKWELEKYREGEMYYPPTESEAKDVLSLKADMTFESVTEGTLYKGTWMFNTNGEYIELNYGQEEREKIRIKFLTKATLVVTYDTDDYRYTEVHYVSSN